MPMKTISMRMRRTKVYWLFREIDLEDPARCRPSDLFVCKFLDGPDIVKILIRRNGRSTDQYQRGAPCENRHHLSITRRMIRNREPMTDGQREAVWLPVYLNSNGQFMEFADEN